MTPSSPAPRLTIGLPVYNGDNFLAESIESILSQTFTDFELLISDNASTDGTADICARFAQQDSRISYIRNEENLGAAPNFNNLVSRARAPYFKWAAHDDIHAPDFLQACVDVLDSNPDVVLCSTKAADMAPNGDVLQAHDFEMNVADPQAHVRFHEWMHKFHYCVAVFGVIRTDILLKTSMIGAYTASDRNLLAELSLYGKFHEIREVMFYRREHEARHMRVFDDDHERLAWFDTKMKVRFHFPAAKRGIESLKAISRAPLGFRERTRCYGEVFSLLTRNSVRSRIWNDVIKARMD